MAYNKPFIQTTNLYQSVSQKFNPTQVIFTGRVADVDDTVEGGRIKVRVSAFGEDVTSPLGESSTENLTWYYPLLPRHFHILPQVGEAVIVFVQDFKNTAVKRYWLGSVVSQLQKIKYDDESTSVRINDWSPKISSYPDAAGVFPEKDEVALIGKNNTDIILRDNELQFRAGKHENDNVYKLNVKNPASITMTYEPLNFVEQTPTYQSRTLILSDKIGLISHEGNPNFKAVKIDNTDRDTIFANAHPIARGDLVVEALQAIINAIKTHIHDNSTPVADKSGAVKELDKIETNLENILQKNIVIN